MGVVSGGLPESQATIHQPFTNVLGTIRLLDFCRCMAVPAFVFASSSSVHVPDTPLPAREDHPANPCSPYALTKLHGGQWGGIRDRGSWIEDRR